MAATYGQAMHKLEAQAMTPSKLKPSPNSSTEAYVRYLDGIDGWNARQTVLLDVYHPSSDSHLVIVIVIVIVIVVVIFICVDHVDEGATLSK
ncbi:hypothetical protein MMC29_006179 [Sticta canariensis]|nr:hypothetical protein [Sticta canariensis]